MGDRRTLTEAGRSARVSSGATALSDAPIEIIEQALGELARLFDSPRVHERRTVGSGVEVSRTGLRCLTLVDRLGPVSVTKLATVMDLSQATASRAIASLETRGLLAGSADPGDGRVTYYTTTAAGRRALQRVQRFMYGQLGAALEGMTADRQRDLASTLTELVQRLQDVPLQGEPQPSSPATPGTTPAAAGPGRSGRQLSGREESAS